MYGAADRFIELLKPNYSDALKYCRALCSGRHTGEAEDVIQQSLLQALEHFGSLNDASRFRSWFFTIITRVFYSSIRRGFWKRFLPLDKNENTHDIPEVFNRTDNIESKLILQDALSRLSSKERASILLYEIAEFKIEEIKEILRDGSVSAVKSRLSRTREKLRKYILAAEGSSSVELKRKSTTLTEDIGNETIRLSAEFNRGK